jgi:Arc/MetJ-type ribon-helix-helix transcriptional regulator
MAYDLSPQTEQYLANIVAGGLFPSREAAIEAAVVALREKTNVAPSMPTEHFEKVEVAIESDDQGRLRPWTADDWSRLHQVARNAAARNHTGG